MTAAWVSHACNTTDQSRLLRMANVDLPTVTDNGPLDAIDGCCEIIESDGEFALGQAWLICTTPAAPSAVHHFLSMPWQTGNLNNLARVSPAPGSADSERRERMMKKGGRPTDEEPQS